MDKQKDEDKVVEAMAKAMAAAEGFDPDDKEVNAWDQFKSAARRQYRAHVAMQAALECDRRVKSLAKSLPGRPDE